MSIMRSPGSGEGIAIHFNETEDDNLPTKKSCAFDSFALSNIQDENVVILFFFFFTQVPDSSHTL